MGFDEIIELTAGLAELQQMIPKAKGVVSPVALELMCHAFVKAQAALYVGLQDHPHYGSIIAYPIAIVTDDEGGVWLWRMDRSQGIPTFSLN
jgi:hypothetical protein